jgi:hypothetical protein
MSNRRWPSKTMRLHRAQLQTHPQVWRSRYGCARGRVRPAGVRLSEVSASVVGAAAGSRPPSQRDPHLNQGAGGDSQFTRAASQRRLHKTKLELTLRQTQEAAHLRNLGLHLRLNLLRAEEEHGAGLSFSPWLQPHFNPLNAQHPDCPTGWRSPTCSRHRGPNCHSQEHARDAQHIQARKKRVSISLTSRTRSANNAPCSVRPRARFTLPPRRQACAGAQNAEPLS